MLLLLSLLWSCQQEDTLQGTGGQIDLVIQDGAAQANRSLPGEVTEELAKQFSLQIRDAYKNWYKGTFGDYATSNTLFAPGKYSISATHGENPDVALDNPYYVSEPTSVDVVANQIASATVRCYVGNAMATFAFSKPEQVQTVLSTYEFVTEVKGQKVSCTTNDGHNPYFKAGETAVFYLKGQTPAGKSIEHKIAEITDVQPRKNYCFTLTLGNVDMGSGAFDITVQEQVEEISINETLPDTFIPRPKIEVRGLFNDNTLNHYETSPVNPVRCTFNAYRPLEDYELTLNFADEQLKQLNKTYLYSQISEEEKKTLHDNGIVLPQLDGAVTTGVLDFSEMIPHLKCANSPTPVANQFAVRVKANGRWSDMTRGYINILKPEFTVKVFYGDVWTKEMTLTALRQEDVTQGDWNKLKTQMQYQFSADGKQWETLGADMRKGGLNPGTEYYVRPLYRGAIAGTVQKVTTYKALQAKNNSFDEHSATFPKSDNPLYIFEGGWIDTRNSLTCHEFGANAFYVSKSSTLPETDQGRSVARLMTIGWGEGNTCSFGKKENWIGNSVIKNISAGLVCVGSYEKSPNEKITGHKASVRPTAMKFTYRATPFKDDEYQVKIALEHHDGETVSVIGEGMLQSNRTVSNYEEATINVNYNDLYRDLPITHIKVEFYGGTKSDWDHLPNDFRDASVPYTYAYICGSEFWLDSFSFIYDK